MVLSGVVKRFGGNPVLRGVDFSLHRGEVHALAGANGSGKSTLMKIVYGAHRPTAGTMTVAGQPVRLRSPAEALRMGIAAVPQELPLVPSLSVAENVLFGDLPRRHGVVRWSQLHERAAAALAEVGAAGRIDPRQPVGRLELAAQQLVSIARALAQGAGIVVFDEPTSSLDAAATHTLFEVICRLRDEGRAIAFISQRLDDIAAVATRVSVLRDGILVGELSAQATSPAAVAELMAGHSSVATVKRRAPRASRSVLDIRDLAAGGRLHHLSLSVAVGEVVGVAGLPGSGAEDLLPALFGRRRVRAGEVAVDGTVLTGAPTSVLVRNSIAYVSGDRKSEGLVAAQTVAFNLTLALNSRARLMPLPRARQRRLVRQVIEALRIQPPDPGAHVGTLSGGNQQKVIVGRWLLTGARLWLLNDPTRGVDVHARADIHRLVRQQVAQGGGAIMTSSDIDELLQTCDRLLVVCRGSVVAELDPACTSEHQVLALSGGSAADPVATQAADAPAATMAITARSKATDHHGAS